MIISGTQARMTFPAKQHAAGELFLHNGFDSPADSAGIVRFPVYIVLLNLTRFFKQKLTDNDRELQLEYILIYYFSFCTCIQKFQVNYQYSTSLISEIYNQYFTNKISTQSHSFLNYKLMCDYFMFQSLVKFSNGTSDRRISASNIIRMVMIILQIKSLKIIYSDESKIFKWNESNCNNTRSDLHSYQESFQ
ncbi:Hypothetical_protein [Hexamita inflata]|uniref:Hypothetical_protein n=1 Tax=Hexamita inflata TaxID=28002 RepID=A0AA86R6K4_9EUKA|nr:Hypothetical protein HINF_LOCUS54858 [Hexamita inflata]CAI9967218.1 Hypothetical protein HINF_LOCUS54863 [Hexamita inflata]